MPTWTKKILKTLTAPVNGMIMCGATGVQVAGAKDWFNISQASVLTIQMVLVGTLTGDVKLAIQVCQEGGESDPVTLTTLDPTTAQHYAIANQCWDRIRINCTTYHANGKGSQALISAR